MITGGMTELSSPVTSMAAIIAFSATLRRPFELGAGTARRGRYDSRLPLLACQDVFNRPVGYRREPGNEILGERAPAFIFPISVWRYAERYRHLLRCPVLFEAKRFHPLAKRAVEDELFI